MVQMFNHYIPTHLQNTLLNRHNEIHTHTHNTRNTNRLYQIITRTVLYSNHFHPSTVELCSGDCQKSSHLKFIRIFLLIQENKKNLFILVPVLHTHFSPYSSPRTNEYILVFPPERYVYTNFPPGKSVYTHLSPLIFRGEIWVYTEVSPSYSILPLCTDRLYNQIKFWLRGRPFDFEGGGELGRFLK